MHYKKVVSLLIILPSFTLQVEENKTISQHRKSYGLSFNNGCANYVAVFKCMTACKRLAYQIFRMDFTCKCTCHEMKTSTILPFFKWKTNGTTKTVPRTQSPGQYDVVGTLSPIPDETTTLLMSVDMCERCYPPPSKDTEADNSTDLTSGSTANIQEVATTVAGQAVANTDAAKSKEVTTFVGELATSTGKPTPADNQVPDTPAEETVAP